MLSIAPDQLAAAGGFIAREWGDYGYRIEGVESPTHRVSLFHVCASDGARFVVAADRWGNCRDMGDLFNGDPADKARAADIVREMHAAAAA